MPESEQAAASQDVAGRLVELRKQRDETERILTELNKQYHVARQSYVTSQEFINATELEEERLPDFIAWLLSQKSTWTRGQSDYLGIWFCRWLYERVMGVSHPGTPLGLSIDIEAGVYTITASGLSRDLPTWYYKLYFFAKRVASSGSSNVYISDVDLVIVLQQHMGLADEPKKGKRG